MNFFFKKSILGLEYFPKELYFPTVNAIRVDCKPIREVVMNHKFYDVKAKASVETAITECVVYGTKANPRYAVRGKTKDGRALTCFVKKEDFDKIKKAIK